MTTADGTIVGTTKIIDNGPPSLRFNLVILGDGYQAGQMAQYANDVQRFVDIMFSTIPFDEFSRSINVYRVDVISTDSGADDPATCGGSGATARTYFDATFCSDGVNRRSLVVSSSTALYAAISQVPEVHTVLVVVNSAVYGGTGGAVGVYSLAAGAEEIALHEMGHAAFGLADEYEYLQGCASGETGRDNHPLTEPAQVNITISTSRATLKWRSFVAATTPIPTTRNPDCTRCDPRGPLASPVPEGTVGLFEGAHYFHCKCFRPEFNCRMRALNFPFCRVCREHIREVLAPYSLGMWGSTDLTTFVFGGGSAIGDPIAYVTEFPGQGPTAHVAYSTANRIHELFYNPTAGGWANADLLSFGGPSVAGHPIVYVTDFPGQGPATRIVYHTASWDDIYELSYVAAAGVWVAENLTFIVPGPSAAGNPVAYLTDFPGLGPTEHIVYRGTGSDRIYELSHVAATGTWGSADLTTLGGGAPAAGDPIAYLTDFPGQGPAAHIVYRTANGRIYELSHVAATGTWGSADLTTLGGGAPAAGDPIAYLTDFPGQGPAAHIVYRTANGRIYELSHVAATGTWGSADLTTLGGGAPAAGDPIAYLTDFPGQGPAAHIVYRTANGRIYELSHVAATGTWGSADLTTLGGGAPAAGDPIAYLTDFPGQRSVTRIVYRTANGRIYELFYSEAMSTWGSADLTTLGGGAPAAGDPIAYLTDFPGQGPTAHFVYRTDNDHVCELFYIASRVPDSPN